MDILQKIKSLLGLGSNGSEPGETETTVTVERESDDLGDEPVDGETPDEDEEIESDDDEAAEPDDDEEVEPDDGVEDGDSVELIKGIGPAYGERLATAGILTVDQLAAADPGEVAEEASVSENRASTWIERAKEF